jgi:catechol 2,3-dioxygenase-like lactoylglutathione lyase family enzyme
MLSPNETGWEATMAKVLGLGGIFFKSPDPAKLSAWYRDVLGMKAEDWGGVQFTPDSGGRQDYVLWSPFKADTTYFAPSQQPFMINLRVDDLDGIEAMLTAKGVPFERSPDETPFGRFSWIVDPDGNKVELWEPGPA